MKLTPLILVLGIAAVVGAGLLLLRQAPPTTRPPTTVPPAPPVLTPASGASSYAGSKACASCHEQAYHVWSQSHHALAERPYDARLDTAAFVPSRTVAHGSLTSTIRSDADGPAIVTTGPDGRMHPFTPARVIGVAPLRQFVIAFERGAYQVAALAHDPAKGDWFDVFGDEDRRPEEWGFWGNRGMTWNSMCAGCHMTALRKNYDAPTDTYATTWEEMAVGCEACHGPYGAHVEWHQSHPGREPWPGARKRSREEVLANCGSCHARRAEITSGFVPGEPFLDHFRPVLPGPDNIYFPDGQVRDEDFEYGSFILSRMHGEGVRCVDCHEPHTAKIRLPGNDLCLGCHRGKIAPGPHSHHDPAGAGGQCVNCHMPITVYMQRHPRRDHGFTIPDPLLTRELGIPNACNRCHDDRSVDWTLAAVNEWYGDRMDRNTRHRTRQVALGVQSNPAAIPGLLALVATEKSAAWKAVAAGLLGQWLDRDEVVRAFASWLESPEALLRAAAVRALEFVPSLWPALRARLEDPVRLVRVEAAWALRRDLDLSTRAAKELLTAMDQTSDQPGGALQQGQFYLDRGRPRQAIPWMERAAKWDPATAEHRGALALALQADGRIPEALEALSKARDLAPEDPQWPYALGLAYAEARQLEHSKEWLLKACRMDSGFARAWYNLGLAYAHGGQSAEAIEALRQAEQAEPENAQFPYARATVHRDRGELDEARQAARRASTLAPEFTEARHLLDSLR